MVTKTAPLPHELVTHDDEPTKPSRAAWRRATRDPAAVVSGVTLGVIVVACLLAPTYARYVGTSPNKANVGGTVQVDGKRVNVVDQYGIPIGPTWQRHYFLGADRTGHDIAVRALYGGRNSLQIGLLATLISLVGGVLLGVAAGYFRGLVDGLISRVLDVIWAFPATILGIALGVTLAVGGLQLGPISIRESSTLIPAIVIGVVYIPYIARPLRGEVMALGRSEFIDAARMLGYGPLRIMRREVLPNLWVVLVPFFALQFAQSIVLEASLSFLGAGVQPPNASWGTMLADGVEMLASGVALHLTLVPCLLLIVTVFAASVFAQRLRRAFEPEAMVHVQ
jgi:peptide/nickel transport system permease protein